MAKARNTATKKVAEEPLKEEQVVNVKEENTSAVMETGTAPVVETEHIADAPPLEEVLKEEESVNENIPLETAAEIIEEHYDGPVAAEEIDEQGNGSESLEPEDHPVADEDHEEEEKVNSQTETAPENESIYSFSVEKLEAYLASDKGQDRIIQETRGGNFISSKDHVIYVPITLFK